MKTGQRISCLFLFVFVVFAIGAAEASVTTTRDDKGVWFIEGDEFSSMYDVFEAMGYAVATDRLWQAETYRRMARGRLAEITGAGMLSQDMLARITGYTSEELTAGYEAMDPEAKDMIDGYVDGFNRRIGEVSQDPSQLPFEFHAVAMQLGESLFLPEPWTPEDVLAWQAALLRQFDPEANRQGQIDNAWLLEFLTGKYGDEQGMMMFNDLRWENDPAAITYIPDQAMPGAPVVLSARPAPAAEAVMQELPEPARWENIGMAAESISRLWSDREESLKKLGIYPKMGSYAWVISGDKTESGKPIIYSGPQMGFDVPSIVMEGSIDAAGMKVSGMAIPGLPGIVIGRTPHHAWSMQVGHARTVDYYFEPAPGDVENYYTLREETIEVAGAAAEVIPVYRTPNGPVVNPVPFNPATYDPASDGPIISWRYAHWGKEFDNLKAFLDLSRAGSMDDFGDALLGVAVSQHFCYADRDGNIAYWMSGVDPVRSDQVDWRLPQGMLTDPAHWEADNRKPLPEDRNTEQGFYAGWNNKSRADRVNAINNTGYSFGPFHRTHVLDEYLLASDILTYEEIRDLALYIATTDSFGRGGNPYAYVEDDFRAAVQNNPTPAREEAIEILDAFDGHFVAGGDANWVDGMDRSDGWILADAWIREVLRLTFGDELAGSQEYDADTGSFRSTITYFNVLLHALAGDDASLVKQYNWFQNESDPAAPQTAEEIIVAALDAVLVELPLNDRPWGTDQRGEIEFNHRMFNDPPVDLNPLHAIPFASRSTYAHVVEMADYGQSRIESMFPLGQSGTILLDENMEPAFDEHFFSMNEVFDDFSHRDFPVFAADADERRSSSTCFIESLVQGFHRQIGK